MEWSRVKNILIVLLAIVNVFLFFVYIGTSVEDAKGNEELVANTVSVLQKNGITVSAGIIPLNNPILYPATGTLAKNVLSVPAENGRFKVEAEGDISSLARRAGISIRKESDTSAYLTVNGIPVYNGKITYDGTYFEGIAVDEIKTLKGDEPQGICTLLAGTVQYLPKCEIQSITQGFFFETRNEDEIYLLPVWRITTTEGVFYINAMSGEKAEY